MVARVNTVAFQGVDVQNVDVQVQISNGMPAFTIVGLPDKAVAESKERVRAALHALGIALPPKRLTVNLAPADVAKEGSHYDLPIALGLLAAMEILPKEELARCVVLGELSLDAAIRPVAGVLPAAMHAAGNDNGLICPAACGGEAAWAGDLDILAPRDLLQLINHMKGTQVLGRPEAALASDESSPVRVPDLADVRGQETAKRALEIAAAGGHNMLMSGPPGSGKSMLASCLPGILPPLSPAEALEVSMIHSLAGTLPEGGLMKTRPFRDPHHSASLPALIGGGQKAKPGEISLAHRGVLFLDELPEFARGTLEALRQPLESGRALVARVNQHVTYPARFQLIAAMNPCRCGNLGDPDLECTRAPRCAVDYQAKLSGPLLDRIDLRVEVPAVSIADITGPQDGESSQTVRARVMRAQQVQQARMGAGAGDLPVLNAFLPADDLEKIVVLQSDSSELLKSAAEKLKLSARAYYRLLRVARTIADLAGAETVGKDHVAEALSYRPLKMN
ncbi:MAG: YifB family Mg chelatase-like AAA ATPase [Rhodospirillales bacterium]|nr:YifB family Mg chelatase-like AAA ATPase [Rhodospirillales bacterium]MCB9997056.1 YifB family Mg chelatase-like AAA ATPase [Rhodospirillales bacterium]